MREVKSGVNTLTPAQVAFMAKWRGECYIVRNVDDALDAMSCLDTHAP